LQLLDEGDLLERLARMPDTTSKGLAPMAARPWLRRLIAVTAVLGAAALPSSASAGALVADATDCAAQSLSQPFLPWADVAQYTLQPGGSFEDGSEGWALDGAKVTRGNEPYYVTSESDGRSLTIADGGAATSGSICVGIEHPDIRFFAKGSSPGGRLNVEVLFTDASGAEQSLSIGAVTLTKGWTLTPPFVIGVNLLPLLPDGRTSVAFRFTARGGDFAIDDVYVDPIQRW
jgi:hypothetical protein